MIRLDERALEDALLAAIRTHAMLFTDNVPGTRKAAQQRLQEEIKACQSAVSRYQTLLTTLFEDYAEERINKREYLSKKQEIARRQEEIKSRFAELTNQLVQVQEEMKRGGIDFGKYGSAKELTREVLVELVKEVRVSGKDMLEIKWSFRESYSYNDEKDK